MLPLLSLGEFGSSIGFLYNYLSMLLKWKTVKQNWVHCNGHAEQKLKGLKLRSERNNSTFISKSTHSASVPTNVNLVGSKGTREGNRLFFLEALSSQRSWRDFCLLIAVWVCDGAGGKEMFFSSLCFICVCEQLLSSTNFIPWNSDVPKPGLKGRWPRPWVIPSHGAAWPPSTRSPSLVSE